MGTAKDFHIRAVRTEFDFRRHGQISLYAGQKQGNDFFEAQPLEFKLTGEYEKDRPFLEISKHSAQIIMDDLWECGLRPSEGSGSAGSLKATQSHLADMKKIAFNSLKIQE